jgi:arylsulfatase A-like enzyme
MRAFLFSLICIAALATVDGDGRRLAQAADKPNIIIFLADDLGYADIGVNGCKDIPTPNIDSIAVQGVRFTDGYATHCVCSPSRAGLMSGLYQHRFGFEHNSGPERFADPNFGLPRDIPTLAEKLRGVGYQTGMIGKWHIGFKEGLRPHERGFDFHFGFLSGARTYLPGQHDADPLLRNGQAVATTKYLTDEFADQAVSFIEQVKDQPYLLYFPFNAVHSPMDPNAYQEEFPELTGKRKIFAGMLTALDRAIGRVMAKVRERGEEEETLVFFYSDNGGPTSDNSSRNTPLRGYKAQFFEGGIRVPFAIQWKGKVPAGLTFSQPVMGFDVHATALAAAGVEVANDKPLDGVDLLPYLRGELTGRPHEALFWRAGDKYAVRLGDWKLVHEPMAGETMLFNLAVDIGEQENLAEKEVAKLRELQLAFDQWASPMEPARWVRQDQSNAEVGGKLKASGSAPGTARRAKGASRIQAAFQAADSNRDGQLTREEYPQPEIFEMVDTNHDGFATLEEVRAYYLQLRAQPGAKAK